ncbi:MAG: winged helix-turn-helix transcriptional regulator [Chloroflexi bacterium]|nr:winged helix-turn-helix transcriptional regulator [Chloroflexota bacterium]MBI3741640.1 winged helix-turn-helix transcriptional regulator [Chloroflexota bacterium]
MSNVRQVVLETLRKQGPLPIDDLAHAAKLSAMAMRYHLGLLEEQGLIVCEQGAPSGVGRPAGQYALADCACAQLPKQYDWLSENLLNEIDATLGKAETRAFLRKTGKIAAESAPALRKDASSRARVERAAKFLSQRGYMATWQEAEDGFALSICNCPYGTLARQHPELCEMDSAMLGALMDAPVKMTCCMMSESNVCEFKISKQ